MNELEQSHLTMLSAGPCVSPEYVQAYYDLPWPFPEELRKDFELWASERNRRPACGADRISRFELEGFIQQHRLLPKKWLAARMGMQTSSLEELLSRLEELGMRPRRYIVYQDLISESLPDDLVANLPALKFRAFGDHNQFCERLHADLKNRLGLDIKPLFCAASERLGEYPKQYARDFDCLTCEPLCGKHQLWLDFRKPLNLPPDRCSKLLYVEYHDQLKAYYAGSNEPDDLEPYAQFLASEQHA